MRAGGNIFHPCLQKNIGGIQFGSLVLGTAIKGEIPPYVLLTGGIIASAAGALGGIIIVTLCEEK